MAETDIRTNTLPRLTDSAGLTIVAFDQTGNFAALDPVGAYPAPEDIGAADAEDTVAALLTKQSVSEKGLANGYAGLDANGKIPLTHLPGGQGGVSSGEVALSDGNPNPLGITSPGTSGFASRSDHVHPLPSPALIGAAPVVHTHTIGAVNGLQAELDACEHFANKGIPNGYAGLGSDGKIPAANLPPGISANDLTTKADAAETTAALALKANAADVQAGLDLKAAVNDPRIVNAVQPGHLSVTETFSGTFGIASSDANKVKFCTSTTDVPMTLNTQAKGFTIRFIQTGNGKIVFAADPDQTVLSFSNLLSTAGPGADVTATVYDVGKWHLSGRLV